MAQEQSLFWLYTTDNMQIWLADRNFPLTTNTNKQIQIENRNSVQVSRLLDTN